jgi:hypothetical protein
MAGMNVRMRKENNVPLLFAHVQVEKEPKVVRRRRFVGFREGFKALAARALDVIHDSFWVPEQEVLDAGKQSVTYYGVEIKDEPGGQGPELIVNKYDGKAHPGAALYFEVVEQVPAEEQDGMHPPTQPESKAKAVGVRPQRPASANRNGPPSFMSKLNAALSEGQQP